MDKGPSSPLKTLLSFDVEVWCNGWTRLDDTFPSAFQRYVYGHSRTEGGALPLTLRQLKQHGVRGVFFVEPLFAARFGVGYLREIVDLIAADGHEIQLHLHSEWADEIHPRPLPHIHEKKQHLQYLSFADQLTLIQTGLALLKEAGASGVTAFRAGGFAANSDTFRAIAQAGLRFDSSINAVEPVSVPDLRATADLYQPSYIGPVLSMPLTVFRDGSGRLRPAQIGSCSFAELCQVLLWAADHHWPAVTLISHNFEMLRPDSSKIDQFVARRFERLCAFIKSHSDLVETCGYNSLDIKPPRFPLSLARTGTLAFSQRFVEQIARRALPA